jgi:excisionase family DNA binding protein
MNPLKKLFTVGEASEMLGCSQKTIRRLIDEGRLQGCKIRGCLRVTAGSLDSYIREQISAYQLRDGDISGSTMDQDGQADLVTDSEK